LVVGAQAIDIDALVDSGVLVAKVNFIDCGRQLPDSFERSEKARGQLVVKRALGEMLGGNSHVISNLEKGLLLDRSCSALCSLSSCCCKLAVR
jgi:hypothetical protein